LSLLAQADMCRLKLLFLMPSPSYLTRQVMLLDDSSEDLWISFVRWLILIHAYQCSKDLERGDLERILSNVAQYDSHN